jgi:hypothetical protein
MQRKGKTHAAGSDGGTHKIDVMAIIRVVDRCKRELELAGHEDPAFYFEVFGDWIKEDVVKFGRPFEFENRTLGL